jgi:vacuolar-type H+-ATPase subunit I/STV1
MYWAWVHRDLSAQTRWIGFVAAVAGALVGGWLGFNTTVVPVALVTTIVGATAAANLFLILLDISHELLFGAIALWPEQKR